MAQPPNPQRRPPPPTAHKPKTTKPELIEFSGNAPDPIGDISYTGNIETDSAAELTTISAGFRQRMANEQARVNDELDSENWFTVVFETRAQKEAFLRAVHLLEHGDKYLDGRDVAQALGVDLPPSGRKFRPTPKIDPKLAALAKPVAYRR